MKYFRFIGASVAVLAHVSAALSQVPGYGWDSTLSSAGVNGEVAAFAVFGGRLVVGGSFDTVGNSVACDSLATYSGTTWGTFGGVRSGAFPGVVRGLATTSSELFVVGDFDSAGGVSTHNVARWTGSAWLAADAGLADEGISVIPTVRTTVIDGVQRVFIAALTNSIEGQATKVWEWNSQSNSWEQYGPAFVLGGPQMQLTSSLAAGLAGRLLYGDQLLDPTYFACASNGGLHQYFEGVDIVPNTVPPGQCAPSCDSTCFERPGFAVHASIDYAGTMVAVGGTTAMSGDLVVGPVARFSGTWGVIGSNPPNFGIGHCVEILSARFGFDQNCIQQTLLIVGGEAITNTFGTLESSSIQSFNGAVWAPLGGGISGGQVVRAVKRFDGSLYVGGSFAVAGGIPFQNFAKYGATCRGDMNGDGVISLQDWYDFLTAYFGSSLCADFNGDGVVSQDDIYAALGAIVPNVGTACP